MELQALGYIDVTPRTTGILELWSMSTDGIYEVREHLCGHDSYKLLSRGNYTDIPLTISANTCIKIANILDKGIHVSYNWNFGGGINALLVSTAVLYVFFLIIIGILVCVGCGFGGRLVKYIYETKIQPYFARDTCQVDPCILEPIPIEERIDIGEDEKPMRPLPTPPITVNIQHQQTPPPYQPPQPSAPTECVYIKDY